MAHIHVSSLIRIAFVLLGALAAQGAAAQSTPPPPDDPGSSTRAMPVQEQTAAGMEISWEVRSRFRLFREERDFQIHVATEGNRSILAAEQALELQSDGRGWARNTVNRLCIDFGGHVSEPCTRDNVKESYLTPTEHPVTVRLTGAVPVGAVCAWSFDDGGDGPRATRWIAPSRSISAPATAAPPSPPSMCRAVPTPRNASSPRSRCATS